MKHFVFVYGTLLSSGARPASGFINAEVVGRGYTAGKIYNLGWFPGFKPENIKDGPCSVVVGEVIAVDADGLERLDMYEGVPDLYVREEIRVVLDNGQAKDCFVYTYNGDCPAPDLISCGNWLVYCREPESV